ncbi:MAG: CapA family protein [Muribaculaceae bacterium]|nr:CapA family protein [Muribaculaceae bacterium]
MLKILGDICFADGYFDKGCGVGTAIANGADPFSHLKREDTDFWIGNFECVCSKSQGDYFTISPEILKSVKHLNLYGVANNHSMQIGNDGYRETIEHLKENNIDFAGSNERRSTIFTHQGKKIGFMAFSMRPDNFSSSPLYWHIPELSEVETEIKKINDCDFKIAFIHWGYEFINKPNLEQKQLAHWLIDAGIDLVVGMHPHVSQGAEIYKGKYIFYSLGNTVFNMGWEPTKYGLMVNVDLSDEKVKVWSEYTQIGADYFPMIVDDVPKEFTRSHLDSLIEKTVENEIYFSQAREYTSQYTRANRKAVIRHMLKMPMREKIALISDFVNRRFLKK